MSAPVLVTLGLDAVDAIVAIESTVAHPTWNESLLTGEFSNLFSTIHGVRLKGDLVAYLIVHTVLDEVHIVNLAVATASRRQGIARFMLETVLVDLFWQGSRQVYLEVRVSNRAARKLYACLGFEEVSTRKEYYSDNKEDALVLRLDLQDFFERRQTAEAMAANE